MASKWGRSSSVPAGRGGLSDMEGQDALEGPRHEWDQVVAILGCDRAAKHYDGEIEQNEWHDGQNERDGARDDWLQEPGENPDDSSRPKRTQQRLSDQLGRRDGAKPPCRVEDEDDSLGGAVDEIRNRSADYAQSRHEDQDKWHVDEGAGHCESVIDLWLVRAFRHEGPGHRDRLDQARGGKPAQGGSAFDGKGSPRLASDPRADRGLREHKQEYESRSGDEGHQAGRPQQQRANCGWITGALADPGEKGRHEFGHELQ